MKHYEFKIYLSGNGETIDEAWQDACEGFSMDSGAPPDEKDITVEKIEDW